MAWLMLLPWRGSQVIGIAWLGLGHGSEVVGMAWLMLSPWRGSQVVGIAWLTGCCHGVARRLSPLHGMEVVAMARRLLAWHGGCCHGVAHRLLGSHGSRLLAWHGGCRHGMAYAVAMRG